MKIEELASEGTILLGYRGSVAHGMYIPSTDPDSVDDIDFMGVVIPPAENLLGLKEWGSRGTREVFEGEIDLVEYSLSKFVKLLLVANPNVTSLLFLRPEMYVRKTWFGQRLAETTDVNTLNKRVYAELFLTPDSDPWLGLVPADTYSALQDDGMSEACLK